MAEPYEIIASPASIYLAPVGESFPAIDADPPGGNWSLLGNNGDLNYSEDGVSITHEETVEDFRMLGATGIVKSGRTEESKTIQVTLTDQTLEAYRHALNMNAVTDNSGANPPNKEINLYKGEDVVTRAMLIRGPSPYGDSWYLQYEIPRARPGGSPEVVYSKGEPIGIQIEWMVMIDLNANSKAERFGRIRAQSGT